MSKNVSSPQVINNNDRSKAVTNSDSKIDVIKQLIFGESIQEFQSELEAIKADINNNKQELLKLIEETKAVTNQNLTALSVDLNQRITNLGNTVDETKIDRAAIGKMLIELGEKIINK